MFIIAGTNWKKMGLLPGVASHVTVSWIHCSAFPSKRRLLRILVVAKGVWDMGKHKRAFGIGDQKRQCSLTEG